MALATANNDTQPSDNPRILGRAGAVGRARLIANAALTAIPLILLLLGYLLHEQFEDSVRLRKEVDASYEARLAVQRVLSLHQDLETGQRGYVITGSREFLEPYDSARAQLGDAMRALSLVARNQRLEAELAQLERLAGDRMAHAEQSVELRRAGKTEEALALIRAGGGRQLMESIRNEIAVIDSAERRRLASSIALADISRRQTESLTFILLALLGILLFTAAWANARSVRARKLALVQAEEFAAQQEAIFESAKDGIITINASGSIESINPAAASMFGYSPEQAVRRDIGTLFELAPDGREVETFLKRLARSRNGQEGQTREFAGRRLNGDVFPADVTLSAVKLPDGIRYVAIIRDVTERKQIEQLKSEFVSTVSHELRTPLTSISGSLGLLVGGAGGPLPETAGRLLYIAHSNSERLVRLINDILDIEKIESGKMPFNLAPLELAPLLEEAVQSCHGLADERQVKLVLQPVPPGAAIFADSDRMMQVLANLLSNAVKFSPEGGTVTVSVLRLDRRFRIVVADQGEGIPEEFKSRIFSKFAQADSTDARRKGGTGLGLSIVREIVVRHGGAVGYESNTGSGTAFHVDIPAADQADSTDADPHATADTRPALPAYLHVEDDPDMQRLVAKAFEGRAVVRPASSVTSARRALADNRLDAVILDIAMGDGSGLDLLPFIRAAKDHIPVIVFTAQDSDPAMAASVDAILVKSRASLGKLVESVEGLVTKTAMRGAASDR